MDANTSNRLFLSYMPKDVQNKKKGWIILSKKINKRKHKALEEQYEHYVCEFCMEIGAKEAISKLLKDCNHKGDYYYISINDYYKWKKRCENK